MTGLSRAEIPEPPEMNNSKGSAVVVGGQRAHDRLAGVVVVPDRGGKGQDALQDAGQDAGRGVPAVSFEVKLSLERVVDRFDDLAQRLEEPGPGPLGLALARRAQQAPAPAGQGGLEVAAVVVLACDDDLPGPAPGQGLAIQDGAQDLPLAGPGPAQGN